MAVRSKNSNLSYLMKDLQKGDECGFTIIFNEYYTQLVLYAYRITDDHAAAEDIVEEAFISLWNKQGSLSEINSLKSYLYAITRNGSLSWIRKNKRQTARNQAAFFISESFDPTALEILIYSEMMSKIYAAMEKLPRQCKKVFTLHYIEGKKISEIAEELKISIGTANTHKFRGIHLLQKTLLGLPILIFFFFLILA
jgi:RNA polymerase sigma-70 factor (family 1)